MRLLSLLLVMMLLPTVQALSITAQPTELVALEPDVTRDVAFDVDITCDVVTDGVHAGPRVLVHNMTSGHPGMFAAGQTRYLLPEDHCTMDREFSVPVAFEVVGSTDVPGETPLDLLHTFTIEDADGTQAAPITTVTQRAIMAYHGAITATTDTRVQQAGPQKQIVYDITVTNHGNARTMVHWEIVGARPENGQLILPAPLILDSKTMGNGQTTAVANVIYSTPFQNGANNDEETFSIRAIPTSTRNAELTGEPVDLELVGQTKGVYVPGPTALLPVALLLAALARRR